MCQLLRLSQYLHQYLNTTARSSYVPISFMFRECYFSISAQEALVSGQSNKSSTVTRVQFYRNLKAVVKLYQHHGFHVCNIHADQEFACVNSDLLPVELNIDPADSHVGEVECSICTIKECLRSCVHWLPFQHVPKLLIQQMVTDVICCLNQFPCQNGVSIDMSPDTLVTGHQMPDYNLMRLEFCGHYFLRHTSGTFPWGNCTQPNW